MKKLFSLLTVSIGLTSCMRVDHFSEDTYVFTNSTGYDLILACYPSDSLREIKNGQSTTFMHIDADGGEGSTAPLVPFPMARDSVVITFKSGKRLVYSRNRTWIDTTAHSLFNIENYEGTTKGGFSTWKYSFDQKQYSMAK